MHSLDLFCLVVFRRNSVNNRCAVGSFSCTAVCLHYLDYSRVSSLFINVHSSRPCRFSILYDMMFETLGPYVQEILQNHTIFQNKQWRFCFETSDPTISKSFSLQSIFFFSSPFVGVVVVLARWLSCVLAAFL